MLYLCNSIFTNTLRKIVPPSSFYRLGHWGTVRVYNLPMVIQYIIGRTMIQTQTIWPKAKNLMTTLYMIHISSMFSSAKKTNGKIKSYIKNYVSFRKHLSKFDTVNTWLFLISHFPIQQEELKKYTQTFPKIN